MKAKIFWVGKFLFEVANFFYIWQEMTSNLSEILHALMFFFLFFRISYVKIISEFIIQAI